MANFVIKRNGNKVPFDIEKIKASIAAAASEAGFSHGSTEEVVGSLVSSLEIAFEGQEEVSSTDIRDKILSNLDEFQPAVAEAWRRHTEAKGQF